MASENGRSHLVVESGSILRLLAEQPEIFDFFQAVRILEWQARRDEADAGTGATTPAVGEDVRPKDEPVRFRAASGLGFPSAAVTAMSGPGPSVRHREQPTADHDAGRADGGPAEMTVAFMGLTGPSGVLPMHYSDRVLRETRAKNTALKDFLDLFNHRLVSLFYRAWAKYRLPVQFERTRPGNDPVTSIIAALVGLGSPSLRHRLAIDDMTVFHFGGAYARQVPSAASLGALLSAHFALPVEIRPFQARWVRLARSEQSTLPESGSDTSCYARLGLDAVVGEMVLDAGGNFRVRIGPMPYARFAGFIPGGAALSEIIDLVRLYVGPELDFDIQCVVRRDEVPDCCPGGHDKDVPRLGWNTWLTSDERGGDADDPVFVSSAAASKPS